MVFIFYVNFAYITDIYFQWIFNNNIQDKQEYDYIIGKQHILFKIYIICAIYYYICI